MSARASATSVKGAASPLAPLNTPAAGSDPQPGTVTASKLQPIKPPQLLSTAVQPTTLGAAALHAPNALSSSPQPATGSAALSVAPPSASAAPLRVPPLPHWFVVFYAIIKDTDGRDKALKALQYGMRYVRWLMKQSPQRTQQAMALLIAVSHLTTAGSLPSSAAAKSQPAAITDAMMRASSAGSAATAVSRTQSPGVSVPLLLSHITVPLSLVEQLTAGVNQRLDVLAGTFSVIRKGIRLFKWSLTQHAAHRPSQQHEPTHLIHAQSDANARQVLGRRSLRCRDSTCHVTNAQLLC